MKASGFEQSVVMLTPSTCNSDIHLIPIRKENDWCQCQWQTNIIILNGSHDHHHPLLRWGRCPDGQDRFSISLRQLQQTFIVTTSHERDVSRESVDVQSCFPIHCERILSMLIIYDRNQICKSEMHTDILKIANKCKLKCSSVLNEANKYF